MPTPESPLFLAKKPTVPPNFEGVDYADTPRLKAAQDSIIREQWVKSMMARLIREELGKCYAREGVGHLEKCGRLRGTFVRNQRLVNMACNERGRDFGPNVTDRTVERYMEALKDAKVRGYLFEQQNYLPKEG